MRVNIVAAHQGFREKGSVLTCQSPGGGRFSRRFREQDPAATLHGGVRGAGIARLRTRIFLHGGCRAPRSQGTRPRRLASRGAAAPLRARREIELCRSQQGLNHNRNRAPPRAPAARKQRLLAGRGQNLRSLLAKHFTLPAPSALGAGRPLLQHPYVGDLATKQTHALANSRTHALTQSRTPALTQIRNCR